MGIHNRRRVIVSGTALASEFEAITRRPEWQYFLTLGQCFKQMILRLVRGAFAAINTEHAFELALAEVAQRTANAQMEVKGSAVRAEGVSRFVFCRHGESSLGGYALWHNARRQI